MSTIRLTIVVSLLLLGTEARAQDEPAPEQDAQAAFERAVKLAHDHRYQEALQALEQAAALDPTAPILLNLGRMREETGDKKGAVQAYRQVLGKTRNKGLRKEAEGHLQALERLLSAKPEAAQKAPGKAAEPPKCSPPPPAPPSAARPELTATSQPAAPAATPIYKKWWFWAATVGGAVVLAGIAAGATYAATRPASPATPDSALGTMPFFGP